MALMTSYEREEMEMKIQELENEREEFEGVISDVLDCLEHDVDGYQGIEDYVERVNEAIEMLKQFAKELR